MTNHKDEHAIACLAKLMSDHPDVMLMTASRVMAMLHGAMAEAKEGETAVGLAMLFVGRDSGPDPMLLTYTCAPESNELSKIDALIAQLERYKALRQLKQDAKTGVN
jgi:hypothetical protein